MGWLSRIAAIVRSRKLERDLDEELQFHIELKTQENIAAGMPPEEARYAALRAFGGVEQRKEECRTPTTCAGWKTQPRTSATACANYTATRDLQPSPS